MCDVGRNRNIDDERGRKSCRRITTGTMAILLER